MKRSMVLICFLFILFSQIFAQNKLLTVEDVVLNSYTKLMPANLRQLNWLPNSDKYYWVNGSGNNSVILSSSVRKSETDTLIKLSELNTFFAKNNETNLNILPNIFWTSQDEFNFWNGTKYYSFNYKFKKLTKIINIPEDAEQETLAPNKKSAAYTIKNNLFFTSGMNNNIQISFDKDTNIVNGHSVHRDEFGINGGIFWSPKSNYIAYYRMDQTMVTDYPLVDLSFTPARLKNIKYPMAGQASHHVTVGIYDINTGKTVWLKTGEPLDQYLTNIAWSPDEKYLFIAHLNRDQNHMQMKKYDISTGEIVKILFEEKNDKYVEPLNPPVFLPNSNDKFIWQSQRDGYNHLYLYDTEGSLIKQITAGKWVVLSFNGFDKSGKNVFISSTKISPIEKHFYMVNMDSGKMERITTETGMHNVSMNSNSLYFIDTYSNVLTPRIINLVDRSGKVLKTLLTADNPLKDYKIGETRLFSLKNDEGTELYCRMILPHDFDSSKKYPVIVYVYGGPHDQEVTSIYGSGRYFLWFYLMAQKGYIIFTLDNRGSANRGLEFEQATFRHLGTVEIKDQMTGINHLKSFPYVDSSRIGVYGWSYGGFMTTSLMCRTNGAFKVGACGGAVIDWKYYEVMYGERYMDTPQTNPEGYKEASLLNHVDGLQGKLLLCHGTSDPTVVWQNTLMFAKKCVELNKPLDYFPYIGHGHGVSGKDAVHLYTKITNYFLENL